jgi:hypothetical protein
VASASHALRRRARTTRNPAPTTTAAASSHHTHEGSPPDASSAGAGSADALGVGEGVSLGVSLGVSVGVAVGVTVAVAVAVSVAVRVSVGAGSSVGVCEGSSLGSSVGSGVSEASLVGGRVMLGIDTEIDGTVCVLDPDAVGRVTDPPPQPARAIATTRATGASTRRGRVVRTRRVLVTAHPSAARAGDSMVSLAAARRRRHHPRRVRAGRNRRHGIRQHTTCAGLQV